MRAIEQRRRFSRSERVGLYLASGGRCSLCGVELSRGWHADHIQPYSRGGDTDTVNGQALCPTCNQRKGARVAQLFEWSDEIQLRDWQESAFRQWVQHDARDFLCESTPGGGKTIFGARCGHWALSTRRASRLVVVVPTDHLRTQWKNKASELGIELDHRWDNSAPETADFHGIVVTYQAVARSPDIYRQHCGRSPTMVVLDEIHHAGDNLSWGANIRTAFEPAVCRLALSGTPFRSDNNGIPFVRYENGRSKADFQYGYGQAISEGVCRAVLFPHFDGRMEWYSKCALIRATFADELADEEAAQRLRTALDLRGEWLSGILREADEELSQIRLEDQSDAGGLVVCIDQAHAKGIAEILTKISGERPAIAISEDPNASDEIQRYVRSAHRWIVAVRMVSEGVDIPRLRVGVYATNVISELFFRQVVGRFVRGNDTASLYIPADDVLRQYAQEVKQERDHALEEIQERVRNEGRADRERRSHQPGLYVAVDATDLTPTGVILDDRNIDQAEWRFVAEVAAKQGAKTPEQVAMVLRTLHALGITLPGDGPGVRPESPRGKRTSVADQRVGIRKVRQAAVARYVATVMPFVANVNATDVFKVVNNRLYAETGAWAKTATLDQLQRHIDLVESWRSSLETAAREGQGIRWVREWDEERVGADSR